MLTSKGKSWLEPFRQLLVSDDYPELSVRAYSLRSTEAYFQLKLLIQRKPDVQTYRHIRHYLGRLASWARSTVFVVNAANSHHLLTRHVRVRCVQSSCDVSREAPSTDKSALQALVASLTRAGVHNARQMCESRWQALLEPYKKRWESLSMGTTVHAEVTMVDHFYHEDLVFAYGKRYIGCSKPSCFCCGVYMCNHPLQPQRRPCHNNVWIQWSPGELGPRGDADQSKTIGGAFHALAELTRKRIRKEISRGHFAIRKRIFDSSTDISDSFPTVFDSMPL